MKKQNKKANTVGRIGELDPGLIKIGYMKLLKCKRKVITHVELCKGQLISKCLFEVFVWTKIPTKI